MNKKAGRGMRVGGIMGLAGMLFLLCAVSVALGEEKKFTVGVEDLDYTPYYSSPNGNYAGFAREVLDAFAQTKGYQLVYKPLPVKRLFTELLEGMVDFKFPDNPNWAADLKEGKNVRYSQAVVDYIDGVVVIPARKGMGIKSLKTMGTVRGFTPWDYLDLIDSGVVKLDENSNFPGLLKQVMLKRIDGAYINTAVANYHLINTYKEPGGLVFDASLPHTKSSYFVSTIKHAAILLEIDDFLKNQKDLTGKLKAKHGVTLE